MLRRCHASYQNDLPLQILQMHTRCVRSCHSGCRLTRRGARLAGKAAPQRLGLRQAAGEERGKRLKALPTILCVAMHRGGAHLHLHGYAPGAYHSGVQALVARRLQWGGASAKAGQVTPCLQ